ncbi:hypothetical protein NEOKW01_0965 [Nematocida sp. AWRm80]|nr:hypothetical protein NEOKW01_0965 [Nematocida sp. AWRm80]
MRKDKYIQDNSREMRIGIAIVALVYASEALCKTSKVTKKMNRKIKSFDNFGNKQAKAIAGKMIESIAGETSIIDKAKVKVQAQKKDIQSNKIQIPTKSTAQRNTHRIHALKAAPRKTANKSKQSPAKKHEKTITTTKLPSTMKEYTPTPIRTTERPKRQATVQKRMSERRISRRELAAMEIDEPEQEATEATEEKVQKSSTEQKPTEELAKEEEPKEESEDLTEEEIIEEPSSDLIDTIVLIDVPKEPQAFMVADLFPIQAQEIEEDHKESDVSQSTEEPIQIECNSQTEIKAIGNDIHSITTSIDADLATLFKDIHSYKMTEEEQALISCVEAQAIEKGVDTSQIIAKSVQTVLLEETVPETNEIKQTKLSMGICVTKETNPLLEGHIQTYVFAIPTN